MSRSGQRAFVGKNEDARLRRDHWNTNLESWLRSSVHPGMNDMRVPDREVGRIQRAYLFGHYDSRGGALLVVQPSLALALTAYAKHLELDDRTAADVAEEDYVARYTVIVCDRALSATDDGQELLADYRDDGGGYSFGVVQARWHDDARRRWRKWEDSAYAVLWVGSAPTVAGQAGPLREELRIEARDVGEDAWGIALFWPHGR